MSTETKEFDPVDAYDQATQAREILGWLEAVSRAMVDATKDTRHNRSEHVKQLAGLTNYLCADWHNYFDIAATGIAEKHGISPP